MTGPQREPAPANSPPVWWSRPGIDGELVGHYTPNVRSHWLAGALVDSNFEPDVYANLELRRATRKRRGMAKDVVPIDAQKSEPAFVVPAFYFADFGHDTDTCT